MKTTSLLVLSTLLISWLSHNPVSPPPIPTVDVETVLCDVPEPDLSVGRFYIMTEVCGTIFTVHCCCTNGMIGCDLFGIAFWCRIGGPFDCTPDLAGCQESERDCYLCCNPCMS